MKKLFGLIVLCLCFFVFAGNAEASCNAFRISPATGGGVNTTFAIYAEDCTESTYSVTIGNTTIPLSRQTSNPPHIYTATIQGSQLGVGKFEFVLEENGVEIAKTTLTITQNSGGGGGGGGSGTTTGQSPLGGEDCADNELATAVGCIPVDDVNVMARFFLGWALGIAGGVALLMIGLASYRIATSQGDPRRLQGGQELLMSAIGGLLMVVLSVYLLRFIGVDLLGIF